MDSRDIERLRAPGFTIGRRGYERREVDNFLSTLADWLETDAAKELGEVAVKRKLELVGKSTAHILLTTEKESEQLRRRTEEECAELRAEAEAAAQDTKRAADEYAKRVREKADQDARRVGEAASAKAKATIEEGDRRRAHVEGLIADLVSRRDSTLGELERLHGELGATIAGHKPGGRVEKRNGGEGRERPAREPAASARVARRAQ
jgi:cell division septum initiation protein DivIVA